MRAHAIVSVLVVTLGISALSTLGCATYRDELNRGQNTLEQNQHEKALAIFRRLENEQSHFDATELARYAYLRGMTDYRVGDRSNARHWLSIAKSYDDSSPGMLPTDWKARMTEALDEMNGVVHGEGLAALATSRRPGEDVAIPAPTKPAN